MKNFRWALTSTKKTYKYLDKNIYSLELENLPAKVVVYFLSHKKEPKI